MAGGDRRRARGLNEKRRGQVTSLRCRILR